MSTYMLRRSQWIACPRTEVFSFFKKPENLALLTPPWLGFRVLTHGPLLMRSGARFEYEVRPLGFAQRWTTLIEQYDEPVSFIDSQISGPYKSWRHEHRFDEENAGTRVTDTVRYELPFGLVGALFHWEIARRLNAIFEYRENAVMELFKSGDLTA